jgi:hypothetical protein
MSRQPREDGNEGPESRTVANLVAVVAALVLVVLGYWAFTTLEHSRRFQRCLDSGRRNCVDFVSPDK